MDTLTFDSAVINRIQPAEAEATSIDVCAALVGLSRSTLYAMIKGGTGPTVTKVGTRSIITRVNRQKWLAGL